MKKNSPAAVILFMVVISLVFGSGIAVVHYTTLPILNRNETLHRNRVLAQAFDLTVQGKDANAYQKAVSAALTPVAIGTPDMPRTAYRGPNGTVGFSFSGMGFWERIVGIIVLTPDLQNVVNMQFMEQKETPGLGARIEEPWFTQQFRNKKVNWSAPADRRIVIGTLAGAPEASRVDAITGATQTSMALMRFLNSELATLRPLWEKQAGGTISKGS